MNKLIRNLSLVILSMSMILLTTSISVKANINYDNDILSENDIQMFLGVFPGDTISDIEYDNIIENMDYLLDAETDEQLNERIKEKGLEDCMEIVDKDYNSSSISKMPRAGLPYAFSADFVNRNITSQFFNVRLEFSNRTTFSISQCAGYVHYMYRSPSGDTLAIKPRYVDERFMGPGSTRIVDNYSYQHNGQPAKYAAALVLNVNAASTPITFGVEETKW